MSNKKAPISISLKDENSKRGEIRKVILLVSELKRSERINNVPTMFGLPNSPVYEKYYADENIPQGNRAVLEFNDINNADYLMVEEYIKNSGGSIINKRIKEDKIELVLIDTSNM